MEDEIGLQPHARHTNDDVLDLNNAITGAIKQPTDQDNDSLGDAVAIASEQQQDGILLDDQEYEQLNSHAQQRVDDAINALTDVQSDLARLSASDVSRALTNGEKIHTDVVLTHAGTTVNNYNKVIDIISDLKRALSRNG